MIMAKIMKVGQERLKYRKLHQANISTSHHLHSLDFEYLMLTIFLFFVILCEIYYVPVSPKINFSM